jgi:hypothetical protein
MTDPLTAPAWKAGDRAMVVIAQVYGDASGGKLLCGTNFRMADLHPLPPTMSAADAAVLEWAAEVDDKFRRLHTPGDLPSGLHNALVDLQVSLRARTPSPKEETPVETQFTPPSDQSPAEQIHLALEYARDALEHWGEGEFGMGIVDNALSHTRNISSPDRARQIAAAREAVVEAAMALCNERRAAFAKHPPENPASRAVLDACDALRALLTPPDPADPVAELREAAERLAREAEKFRQDTRWTRPIDDAMRSFDSALAALRAQEAK